jgi:hypothetical protein
VERYVRNILTKLDLAELYCIATKYYLASRHHSVDSGTSTDTRGRACKKTSRSFETYWQRLIPGT